MSTTTARRNLTTALREAATRQGVTLAEVEAQMHELFDRYRESCRTQEEMASEVGAALGVHISRAQMGGWMRRYDKHLARPERVDTASLQDRVRLLTEENARLQAAFQDLHRSLGAWAENWHNLLEVGR